jgi:hypothetical protein
MTEIRTAPELCIQQWLNTELPISLESLRGKVVMISVFQMLCPGCVELCLPQAKKVHDAFSPEDITVLGLHSVFEHHEAMQEASLRAFLYEYRIHFPVGIDQPSKQGAIPKTMQQYTMQGTPTILLLDRRGQLRKQHFGHLPDLVLGAEIMSLIKEEGDNAADLSNSAVLERHKQTCDVGDNCK